MRDTCGNDNDIALAQLMHNSTSDGRAAVLIRCSDSAADHRSAGDKSGASVENVERIGFLIVNLGFTPASTVADQHRQIRCCDERSAFCDFIVRYERDFWIGCSCRQQNDVSYEAS